MKISKKKGITVLNDSEDDQPKISYCERCLGFGFTIPLGPRIYKPDEPYREGDEDNWKQCHECGKIVPIYETKKESELSDFVDPIDSPFDQGKSIVGLGNKRKSKAQKERKRILDKANKIKDSEIRREVLKGNIIEDMSDY